MEELMIEIMHEDNINMAWYSFIHEGIKCRGYVEFEEDEEENEADVIRKIEEEKVWDNLDCTLRQAEEKLQHKEPMRRRGRVR